MPRTLALLLALAAPAVVAAQGKLDAVRDAVEKSNPDSRPSDDSRSGDAPSPDENPIAALFGGGSGDAFSSSVRFSVYPYASPDVPYLLPKGPGNEWAARASVETGSDFSGLDRIGLRLFLDSDTRLGLKSDWDYFSERLACGCRDSLWLGDATVTYRLAEETGTDRLPELQIHLGAGVRWLFDGGETRAGLNLYSGFDLFPKRPVHVFGSLEAGTLGAAGLYRAHGGVGWHWSRAELFAGYDYLYIGGTRLQGPFAGVRLWF
jgi:hypothetical protein